MGMKHVIEDGKLICTFSGSMDTSACSELIESVGRILEGLEAKAIEFDLGEVDYVASSFLRLCTKAANKIGREGFSLTNVRPQVKKVFKIAGMENFWSIS